MSFEEFSLSTEILNGLRDINFTEPTPIQSECIPLILEGNDIIASAQTGTGKTGAFVIPILSKLGKNPGKGIKALILTPTRELARQVDEQIMALGYHTGVTSVTVYGGGEPTDWNRQEKAIYEQGVNIIVATPGRLIDHITIRKVDFSNLEFFVLDEADRMLDMGFIPDVRTIESRLPQKRQNLLFSATIPVDIEKFARSITNKPKRVNIATFKVAKGIDQVAYNVHWKQKEQLLLHLLDKKEFTSSIIFVSTKKETDKLARTLSGKGLKVESLHGDRSQKERDNALRDFKSGKYDVLVATDVLSRGIDIEDISHIINYDVPKNVDNYIHRIGRTARAEATGHAVTFVSKRDQGRLKEIKHIVGDELKILSVPNAINNNGHQSKNKSKPVKGNTKRNSNKKTTSGNSNKKNKPADDSKNTKKPQNNRKRRSNNNRNRKSQQKSAPVKQSADRKRNAKEDKADKKDQSDNSKSGNKNRKYSKQTKRRNYSKSKSQSNENTPDDNQTDTSKKRYKGKRRRKPKFKKESQKSFRERQRQSLRDAHATKKALMSNKVVSGPNSKKKKGIFGKLKKIFTSDD